MLRGKGAVVGGSINVGISKARHSCAILRLRDQIMTLDSRNVSKDARQVAEQNVRSGEVAKQL